MKYCKNIFLLSLAVVFLSANGLHADNLTIHFNKNLYKDGRLFSDLALDGNISLDTIDAIQNGITANLLITFQLLSSNRLLARGSNLKGEKVKSFTISYDIWENKFVVVNDKDKFYVDKASDIISKINEIINPLTLRVNDVNLKEKVIFRAKVKIETIKLYPPLGIFLIFFDPWNYESSWISTESFTLETL
jgi:hypothetical protein